MSASSTLVTARHFRYLAERTVQEDEFLRNLKIQAAAAGIPQIWVSPEQASFMQILLKLVSARDVVEVGTLAGYSAIWMARALPSGGTVRTIEILESHAAFAERWIANSDVARRIEVLRGAGADILPTLADRSADACFLDADKAGYPLYLQECKRILRPGGLLMVDNAFGFGQLFDDEPQDQEVPAVQVFNDILAEESGFHSVIVPLGDGLWVGVYEGRG